MTYIFKITQLKVRMTRERKKLNKILNRRKIKRRKKTRKRRRE